MFHILYILAMNYDQKHLENLKVGTLYYYIARRKRFIALIYLVLLLASHTNAALWIPKCRIQSN